MGKRVRRTVISILLGLAVFVIVYAFSGTDLSRSFERYTYDYRFRLRGPLETHPDVVLVGIDDKCEEVLGKECWKVRLNHAHVLDYVSRYLPRAVGFDFLFKGEETVEERREHDREFLDVISYFESNTICTAYNFVFPFPGKQYDAATEREIELLDRFQMKNVSGDLSKITFLDEVSLPFERLAAATDLGFINAPRDLDGGVRMLPMVIGLKFEKDGKTETRFYPSLSLLMSCRYLQVPLDKVEVEIGREIRIPRKDGDLIRVPIDEQGYLLVNFFAEHHGFHPVSFAQLIMWRREGSDRGAELIEDKLLLVGLTVTGSTDENPTPLSPLTPLVTVHLNAINSIITDDFIYLSSKWVNIAVILVLSLGLALCNGSLSPIRSTVLTVLVLAAYLVAGYRAFLSWSVMIPIVPPVMAIVLVYASVTSYRFLSEERQKMWIRKVLGQYLPASVMHEVLEDPEKLKLGGVRKNLTVLFSDIRGFTPMCEKLTAEQVVQILNEYLDKMTECIFKNSGTLDKYVGDEIVAFFGAPGNEHEDDHAEHAILAALDMRDELVKLQTRWKSQERQRLEAGIGINTGEMLVGNMGSSNIFDYTVIGDEVNLGARVEELTRMHDAQIIITENTYEQVKDIVEAVEIGVEKVRGRGKGIRIFEVRGRKDKTS